MVRRCILCRYLRRRLDLHGLGHFVERGFRDRAGLPATVLHDVLDPRGTADQGGPGFPDRRQRADDAIRHKLFAVDAEIPVDTFVDTLAITVSVDILCLRAGVDDPKGGMVGCAFQDATKTHKMMSDPWYLHPRPFEVPWIKICTQL